MHLLLQFVARLRNALSVQPGQPTRPIVKRARKCLQYQAEGVKTVEMESAGLFTVGQVRGVQTASVVIGMDSLAVLALANA